MFAVLAFDFLHYNIDDFLCHYNDTKRIDIILSYKIFHNLISDSWDVLKFAVIAEDLPETPEAARHSLVSTDQLTQIAELVEDKWERLAAKFTMLDEDELNYFKEKDTPLQQATNMLTVWKVRWLPCYNVDLKFTPQTHQ